MPQTRQSDPNTSPQADRATAAGDKKDGSPPTVAVLIAIGSQYDLWHDTSGAAYATGGRHSWAVDSRAFGDRLALEYYRLTERAANRESLASAVNTLRATARYEGECREAAVRLAGHNGRVYLHLADAGGTVIEVDADGWRVCPDPPVRFVVPAGMLPLPMPVSGGHLDELRPFVNLPDDTAFTLLKAVIVAAAQPTGPYPVVVVRGEQGDHKSTTTRVLKTLLDPARPPTRSAPKNEHDLMIAATNSRVLAFDNLSGLPSWLSDALCRLTTGGGYATRGLYTNAEEVIFEVVRPVVLNGIPDFVERDDLLDRSILFVHPRIPPERRRLEREFWQAFGAAHPRLLGAVLDRVAGGLRVMATDPPPPGLPRMADFAAWAVACEQGAGEPAAFLRAFTANEVEAREQGLLANPVGTAVVKLMDGRDEWAGTASDLLAELSARSPVPTPRDWPRAANVLTGVLRRLAPALRQTRGLEVDCDGRAGGKANGRGVRITRRQAGGGGDPDGGHHPTGESADGPGGSDDADGPPTPFETGDAWEPEWPADTTFDPQDWADPDV